MNRTSDISFLALDHLFFFAFSIPIRAVAGFPPHIFLEPLVSMKFVFWPKVAYFLFVRKI